MGEADESSLVVADDGRQGTDDARSVDLIPQSLTKRPDVRSTLILSRKDGSIIKVSGSITEEASAQAQNETNKNAVQDQDESAKLDEPKVTRVQMLASSIYAFVTAAAMLGDTLRSIDTKNSSITGRQGIGEEDQAMDTTNTDPKGQTEDEVQLLRLRLKKQEIIIAPNPNYLCCVVQDLEKSQR